MKGTIVEKEISYRAAFVVISECAIHNIAPVVATQGGGGRLAGQLCTDA